MVNFFYIFLHGFSVNLCQDYLTDLVVNRSVQHFRQSKEDNPTKPILTMLSFPAPHGPEDGAPQYQHLYANVTSHMCVSTINIDMKWATFDIVSRSLLKYNHFSQFRTPSYDYVTSNQYKHWILSKVDQPMDKTQHRFSMMLQQKRLQTLRSVDNAIEKVKECGGLWLSGLGFISSSVYKEGQALSDR